MPVPDDAQHAQLLLDIFAKYPSLEREFPDLAAKARHSLAGAWYVSAIVDERERLAREAARAHGQSEPGAQHVSVTRLADVQPQPVRWLWPGRMPLGKLTIPDGDPGLGKSLLGLDLAARVTTARPLPAGTHGDLAAPAGVVILSAEDDKADTIRPRAEAAGADLTRIVTLDAVVATADDTPRPATLLDLDAIRTAIAQVDAKLVIIDPLMAYLPGKVDAHRDQDVRRSLAPLAALAAETGVAVLVVRHLNKTEGRSPLYRGGGSIGIIGAARSGLLVAKDPEDAAGERRVLVSTKCNLARAPEALTYEVKAALTLQGWVPYVAWGEASAHTAASLLNPDPQAGEERGAVEEAIDVLRQALAAGARPAREVQREARAAGISAASLKRARARLGVRATKRGGRLGEEEQRWLWSLPEEAQGAPEEAHTEPLEPLLQSTEKNSRNSADVAEEAQTSELEPLVASDEPLLANDEETV